MELTDDDALLNVLWEQGAHAYRRGWEGASNPVEGDDVKASSRRCHKAPGEYCREHKNRGLTESVHVLSEKEGKQALRKLKLVRDWQGRMVFFSKLARKHILYDNIKDRSLRVKDILFALDAVKTGRPVRDMEHEGIGGQRRWNYLKTYVINKKQYVMQVICLERKNGDREILTFFLTRNKKWTP